MTATGIDAVGAAAFMVSSPNSGSIEARIQITECRNPDLVEADSRWTTTDMVAADLQRGDEITGTFDYNGNVGTFTSTDGTELSYRTGGFNGLDCFIHGNG